MTEKRVSLISLELAKDNRGDVNPNRAISIVKIEGYPETTSYTAISRIYRPSDKHEVTEIKRNDGSQVDLLGAAEFGFSFNFEEIFNAHDKAFNEYKNVEQAKEKERRTKKYNASPLHEFKLFPEFMKYAKMTTLEDYLDTTGLFRRIQITYSRPYKNVRFESAIITKDYVGFFSI